MKRILIALSAILLLAACSQSVAAPLSETELVVGVTPGPHEEVMELVQQLAAEDDLHIELKVFTEYVMPNIALAEGDIDLNIFQHKPYLDDFINARELNLIDVAPTINFPLGFYTESLEDIQDLELGDKVGLPNDPTNNSRALILLETTGLITLAPDAGLGATIYDITENPLELEFIELEAPQIPRQLPELATAAINSNFAIEYGFVPNEDAMLLEDNDSAYVNVIAARTENKDDPVLEKFFKLYHSQTVKEFILQRYQGSIIPAW